MKMKIVKISETKWKALEWTRKICVANAQEMRERAQEMREKRSVVRRNIRMTLLIKWDNFPLKSKWQ